MSSDALFGPDGTQPPPADSDPIGPDLGALTAIEGVHFPALSALTSMDPRMAADALGLQREALDDFETPAAGLVAPPPVGQPPAVPVTPPAARAPTSPAPPTPAPPTRAQVRQPARRPAPPSSVQPPEIGPTRPGAAPVRPSAVLRPNPPQAAPRYTAQPARYTPQPASRPTARPRVQNDEPSLFGLSRRTRTRRGSIVFALVFIAIFVLIFIQVIGALLSSV